MTPIARIPRTRGAFSGVLLVLLGAWGGLIAFIGPYFHYAYTPDKAWVYTTGRLWLEILPGAATVLGGLLVLGSARRHTAVFGAFLAALGGAWFVVGNLVSTLWNSGTPQAGVPAGTGLTRLAAENLGFFTGLGVLIVFFAALALGRFAVVGVRETALVERAAANEAALAEHEAAERDTGPVARTRTDLPPVTEPEDSRPAQPRQPAGPPAGAHRHEIPGHRGPDRPQGAGRPAGRGAGHGRHRPVRAAQPVPLRF